MKKNNSPHDQDPRTEGILGENPVCSVSFDPSIPCITVIWKQYATSPQLRFVQENILDLIKSKGADRILADDTALPTIHAEDQLWIARDWMPRAVAAGLRFAATKKPKAHFGKVAVQEVQLRAPRELVIKAFDSLDDARRWLRDTDRA